MSTNPSIIIPYFNRADTVPVTLTSIQCARGGRAVETIPVDNGSTPAAVEQLQGHSYKSCRTLTDPGKVAQWLDRLHVS